MAGKKKKIAGEDEGPVKIVGVNHSLAISNLIFFEGWKHEAFADVVFYCKPHPHHHQDVYGCNRMLRANRSNTFLKAKVFLSRFVINQLFPQAFWLL